MYKGGKKLLSSLSLTLVFLVVASTFFVYAQSEDLSLADQVNIDKKVKESISDEKESEVVKKYVEDVAKKRGVRPEKINNISQVDFANLPQEVKIENVDDTNVAIYDVDYNDSQTEKKKKLFVVTYSAEQLDSTKDLIIHPEQRQFLHFGVSEATTGSAFMTTASGVAGSAEGGYVMMRQGSITGMSTSMQIGEAAESAYVQIIIYKNGEPINFGNTLSAQSAGSVKDYDTQSMGVVEFLPGDTISIEVVPTSAAVSYEDVITLLEITTVD